MGPTGLRRRQRELAWVTAFGRLYLVLKDSGDHSPSRLYKMFTTQGGIHVPCIVHYPPSKSTGAYDTGGCTMQFSTVMDIMPTILDLAGVKHPAQSNQKGAFKGRMVEPMRGRSWRPWLQGEAEGIHEDDQVHGWELHGRAALRIGDWKMIYIGESYIFFTRSSILSRNSPH